MRKLALAAILLALPATAQVPQSFHGTSGGWGPLDRNHPTHFFAGMACGVAPYFVAKKLGYKHPWIHSVAWAVLAGVAKENYDRRHGGRGEWADVAYTGLGGLTIGFAIRSGEHKKQFATAPKLPE